MTYSVCNTVTYSVSDGVSNGRRTTVQNQNQNQTLYIHVCGVCGYDSIHRCSPVTRALNDGWMHQ